MTPPQGSTPRREPEATLLDLSRKALQAQRERIEQAEAALAEARLAIQEEIDAASDPEGKDQFEKGALSAYHFALAALAAHPAPQGEVCPTCDTTGPHTVMGADGIPDHRWPQP